MFHVKVYYKINHSLLLVRIACVKEISNVDRFRTFPRRSTLKPSTWHVKENRVVDQRYVGFSYVTCNNVHHRSTMLQAILVFDPNNVMQCALSIEDCKAVVIVKQSKQKETWKKL